MKVAERKAQQKENTRQDILDAARDVFAGEGYESASMRKIAERVECAPGTLYLYFHDKAEILDCLCEETFIKLTRRIEAIAKDAGDPLERLRRGLRAYIQFGLDHPSHYTVAFILRHEALDEEDRAECRKCEAGKNCFGLLRHIVESGIQADRVISGDPDELAQAMWAGIHGVTSLLISQCGFPFVEQTRLVERVVDVLVEGVRKR